jgi:hypothetical protein
LWFRFFHANATVHEDTVEDRFVIIIGGGNCSEEESSGAIRERSDEQAHRKRKI